MIALLAALCVQDDVDGWIKKLSDPSIEVREDAARKLVQIGDRAGPALEKASESTDPEVRERAAWAIKQIRARKRAAELGLDKLIPESVRAKVPDLLERAASADAAEKAKLHEDLWTAVEAGTLKESDLTWIAALLRGAVNAKIRTLVYLDARRWWYEAEEEALRESGKKMLADMGEEFLRDWPRILARIADSPDEIILFDPELMTSSRGGTEEGQVSAAAIAELAEMGIPEVVPILVDIATDYNADAAARKAAISAVGKLRMKLKK